MNQEAKFFGWSANGEKSEDRCLYSYLNNKFDFGPALKSFPAKNKKINLNDKKK